MKRILLLFHLLLLSIAVYSQTRLIKGRVLDSKDGEALIGASIKIKGGGKGTTSDVNGRFSINVSDDNTILEVSYTGYKLKEVRPGNQSQLEIRLEADTRSLNEVVVVGYGTQSRRAVTGSVASVNYEKFKDRSVTNVTQALAGQLPGVNITQSQGAPGQSPNNYCKEDHSTFYNLLPEGRYI